MSSATSCWSETASLMLQQKLVSLVQALPEWWAYSIFWEAAPDRSTGQVILTWLDGYFRGRQDQPPPSPMSKKPTTAFEGFLRGRVCDPEWHYIVSVTKSYPASDDGGILGKAFSSGAYLWLSGDRDLRHEECDRVREARANGIETIACVSVPGGVVELGSVDGIEEDWGLVKLAKSLFSSNPNNYQHESVTYRSVHEINGDGVCDFLGNNLSGKHFSGTGQEEEVVVGMEENTVEGKKAAATGTTVRFQTFYDSDK